MELRYYKRKESEKLTREQQDEVKEHRKKHGDYPNTWSKKKGGRNTKPKHLTRAQVAAMIADAATEKETEKAEQEGLKQDLVSGLKDMVTSTVAAFMAGGVTPRKALQRAGANVSTTSVEKLAEAGSVRAKEQDAAAERCAENLMSRFNAMGSKAKQGEKYG